MTNLQRLIENLDVNYNDYQLKIQKPCIDFINEDEEIISAYDIYYFEKKSNSINDYQHYISILENQGVPNAR